MYQGEARRVSDNILLGKLTLSLPRGPQHLVGADVRFTYDVSGLLEVQATPVKDGQPYGEAKTLVIESAGQRMTSEEIAQRLAALEAIKVHPRDRMEARTLLARAERHHMQLLGRARDYLASAITAYEWALESQVEGRIASAKSDLQELLQSIEEDKYLMDENL